MKIEVTGVRNVNTGRGPKAIVQIMFRNEKGAHLVEQWMEPADAPVIGHYDAAPELYSYNNKLGAAFTGFKKMAVAQAS